MKQIKIILFTLLTLLISTGTLAIEVDKERLSNNWEETKKLFRWGKEEVKEKYKEKRIERDSAGLCQIRFGEDNADSRYMASLARDLQDFFGITTHRYAKGVSYDYFKKIAYGEAEAASLSRYPQDFGVKLVARLQLNVKDKVTLCWSEEFRTQIEAFETYTKREGKELYKTFQNAFPPHE